MRARSHRIRGLVLAAGTAALLAGSAAAQPFAALHELNGDEGGGPQSSLIADAAGNLYGTATFGGPFGRGCVFELVRESSADTFQVLHSFTGGSDGASPVAGLVMDDAGNLYGTAPAGGASGHGAIFELVRTEGGFAFQTLYSFTGGEDGAQPLAELIVDPSGNLFGSAATGAEGAGGSRSGSGTLFELVKGETSYVFQLLHSFSALSSGSTPTNPDGALPEAALLRDDAGNLYGTAAYGGSSGAGTVFALFPVGSAYSFQVIHTFAGTADGARPVAPLISDESGNLFGTASLGSTHNWGSVFELAKSGSAFQFQPLYSFTGSADGALPLGGLVRDESGNLAGTTLGGGDFLFGTVFQLVRASSYALRTLYSFQDGSDGANPSASLLADGSGKLYGTTFSGGDFNFGTIFSLAPPPTAGDRIVNTPPDTAVSITLTASDPNLAAPAFTFAIQMPPAHGTLSAISGDQVVYTPNAGFVGSDAFTFTGADADGVSNPTTVSITISEPFVRRIVPLPNPPPAPVGPRP